MPTPPHEFDITRRGNKVRHRYYDPHGIRRSRTFLSEKDALTWARQNKARMTLGTWNDPDSTKRRAQRDALTLNSYFAQTIDDRDLTPRTRSDYRRWWGRFVEPTPLGRKPLADVDGTDARGWYSGYRRTRPPSVPASTRWPRRSCRWRSPRASARRRTRSP